MERKERGPMKILTVQTTRGKESGNLRGPDVNERFRSRMQTNGGSRAQI